MGTSLGSRITEVRGYHLVHHLATPLRNASGHIAARSALAVEICTDEGRSGWGETQGAPEAAWSLIAQAAGTELLGRDPREINRIWRAMLASGRRDDVRMMAVSAVDIALWDLRGRVDGRPIAELIGGAVRDRVTAYASGPFMAEGDDPYRDVLETVAAYRSEGFRAIKLRSGHDPIADAEIVFELRRALGPEFALMIDVNTAYSRAATADLVRRCEGAALGWIEEPIDPYDVEGYVALSAAAPCPIAGGESMARLRDFRELIARGAVGIIQPDMFLCGGITGALRIAALAEAYAVPYLPHVFGSAINLYASLQLAAVLPATRLRAGFEYPIFELDRSENPLRSMLGDPRIGPDGALTVPDGPGIGVEVTRDAIDPYVVARWSVSTP